MSTNPSFDARKFREAIVYICDKSTDDPRFGSVKLNKILFYSDFSAYVRLGDAITGATYRNLSEGPAPRDLLVHRRALEDDQALRMEERRYFNYQQKRPVALRRPNLSVFTAQEVSLLDEVIAFFWGKDATEVSEMSHREWGWKLTREDEDIPYRTAWLSPEPLTEEELEFVRAASEQ